MAKINYLQYGGKNSLTDPFIGSVTNIFNKNMNNPDWSLPKTKALFQFGNAGNTVGMNEIAMNAVSNKTDIWKENMLGKNANGFGDVKKQTPLISKAQGKELGNATLSAAPQIGEMVMQTLGKEADNISGGEELFSKGTDMAFSAALKTGNPWAIGGAAVLKGLDWVNRFGGSTARQQDTAGMSITGYGTQVNTMAGKKNTVIGGLSRKTGKANALTDKYDTRNLLAGYASQTALKDTQSGLISAQDVAAKSEQQLAGRNSYQNRFLSAKNGTKINPAKLRNISSKVKKVQQKSVSKFQEGGKVNVIPEGALHKNLNHYNGELGESVTSKGIPVITKDRDGGINQHAEIEKNEVIFHKEATDKIEAFLKEYNKTDNQIEKNTIAIKAGKYLTYELLENTEDNTGLIDTI